MSSLIRLQNGTLTAQINSRGAELTGLKYAAGPEYMWQAGKEWPKSSPVLFPIVGTLKGNVYTYNGQEYSLPRHGFARELLFDAQQLSVNEAVFTLRANPATLAVFPFHFTLRLTYRLGENGIGCMYEINHDDDCPMYFSIGGHPAFAVPLMNGTEYQDYYLRFEYPENLDRWELKDGLLTGSCRPLSLPEPGLLPLHPQLFYEDAIVLRHLKSRKVSLLCSKHDHGLQFNFEGFPYLGLWAARDAAFVCIEPWCGHSDFFNHTGCLPEKAGIEKLQPGQIWRRQWSVELL